MPNLQWMQILKLILFTDLNTLSLKYIFLIKGILFEYWVVLVFFVFEYSKVCLRNTGWHAKFTYDLNSD